MLRGLRVSKLLLLQSVASLVVAAHGSVRAFGSSFLIKNPSFSAEFFSFLHLAAAATRRELEARPAASFASPSTFSPSSSSSSSPSSLASSSSLLAASCSWLSSSALHPLRAVCVRRPSAVGGGLSVSQASSASSLRQPPGDPPSQPPPLPPRKKKMLASGDGLGGEGLHWAPKKPTAAVIFLHGLGDSAAGWSEMLQVLEAAQLEESTRLVLPTAPVRPVTVNMGMRMNAWSDIRGLTQDAREDKEGLLASKKRIDALIEAEISRGIPPSRIVVGGFSQGGAVAYLVGLTSPHSLGGILALSTWCPLGREIEVSRHYAKSVPHILHCHGAADELVRPIYGQTSVEGVKSRLIDVGAPPDVCQKQIAFKLYPGLAHSASQLELSDAGIFLAKLLRE